MIDQLWNRWKQIRDNDPVKARLVRVLVLLGVIILPFVCEWAYAGFGQAMALAVILGLAGFGLVAAIIACNYLFGWLAHYVVTGRIPDPDDWWDNTVMDEWEAYQRRKANPLSSAPAPAPKSTYSHKPQAPKVKVTNLNPDEDGPDWLKKS